MSTSVGTGASPSSLTAQAELSTSSQGGLHVGALTAIVVGSMIGSGVFSLPQNMAVGAGPLATIIGWLITGIGMFALAQVYQRLSLAKPQLDAGPYAYAKAGFGPFIGFNAAWGYWISAWVGNVSYAVVVFSALSFFYAPFGDGNTWQAVLGASIALWIVHALILSGVRQAALVNLVATIAKIAPIILFIVLAIFAFRVNLFALDFTGSAGKGLGSLLAQVKSTMLVTLWVFIGIEGASVVSGRAARRQDVGRATMGGFLICLVLYALVSLLAYGVMAQPQLATLKNPSVAGVLDHIVGPWGAGLINLALVVSVFGAFLSWTMLAAEIPFVASRDGTMPRFFGHANPQGSPTSSLWITNGLVQLFLIITLFANSTYQALFSIASVAILVPYIFSGAFAALLAIRHDAAASRRDLVIGIIATIYGIWLVYAAGATYLFMCAILYAPGILFFWLARREGRQRIFQPAEAVIAALLVIAGLAAAWLMYTGAISPLS